MNEKNYSPYGSFGLEKINAPKGKPTGEPRSTKIEGNGDLRSRREK